MVDDKLQRNIPKRGGGGIYSTFSVMGHDPRSYKDVLLAPFTDEINSSSEAKLVGEKAPQTRGSLLEAGS